MVKKLMLSFNTKVLKKYFFLSVILMLIALTQTSCQQENKKSVLILAFEQLSPEQLNCSEEKNNENSGFAIVCKESARFSRAYTTSLQPAAAIGSLLTGQYPLIHELHRSFDRISVQQVSLAEAAYKQGYRTSFFGGSPNILKRTGLARYFEVFDDSIGAQYSQHLIKDFKNSTNDFLNWYNEEKNAPFLSIITNAEIGAFNDKDTHVSNFEKLDEKLYQFIQKLKEENIWQESYIIVVGLKGQNFYNRLDESSYTNLHSENTKISLFIKPPRMKGDEGISWKIDDIVNLADLGYSLKKFYGYIEKNNLINFYNIDLLKYLQNENFNVQDDREILIEAANPWTKNINDVRIAYVNAKTLAISKNGNTEFFNTLTDNFEKLVLNKDEDSEYLELEQNLNTLKNNYNLNFNLNLPQVLQKSLDKEDLRNYKMTHTEFKKINELYKTCISLIYDNSINIEKIKQCEDPLFLDYLKYKHFDFYGISEEKAKLTYEISKKKFFEDLKIYKLNMQLENIWGLFKDSKKFIHPLMKYDSNFFN